jgi:hypothetical protein
MRLIVCSTSATGLGASVAWRSWKRRVRHGSISPGGSRWLPVGYVAGFRRELGACERSSQTRESMIEICREHSKNVKRWRDSTMALRWCAAGILKADHQSAASTGTCTCRTPGRTGSARHQKYKRRVS